MIFVSHVLGIPRRGCGFMPCPHGRGLPMSAPQIKIIHDEPNPTVVLWVSRHDPLYSQIKALKQRLGSVRIVKLSGVVPNADYVVKVAEQYHAKVIVPVLPLSFIARLAELAPKKGVTVLFAKMEELCRTTNKKEAEALVSQNPYARTMVEYSNGIYRVWEFKGFEKLVKVEIVTEPW